MDLEPRIILGVGLLMVLSPAIVTIAILIFRKPTHPNPQRERRGFPVIVSDDDKPKSIRPG
jgi:hypothetical protein